MDADVCGIFKWPRSAGSHIALGLLLAIALSVETARAANTHFLDRMLGIEREHADLCATRLSESEVLRVIDSEATLLRISLDEGRGQSVDDSRALSEAPASKAVKSLNKAVLTQLGLLPSQELHDPCNLFPSSVLLRKQGYCVGIVAIYMVLAEAVNLPVYAVATPSHVFLRYDDGITRMNIETTQGGTPVPDEQYITRERIAESSIRKGVFMRNLTADQFLAQVYNNLGVIYSEREQFQQAALEYQAALDLDRHLPAAWYNWGNDLLRSGEYQRATKVFTRSLKLDPNDVWALNNRGQAYRKSGNEGKARRDFEAALQTDPTFEAARKNLERMKTSSP